jgi:hypothetical protein
VYPSRCTSGGGVPTRGTSYWGTGGTHLESNETASQSVFINGDIYRINILTTIDNALYTQAYVANKSVPPIYLRELS